MSCRAGRVLGLSGRKGIRRGKFGKYLRDVRTSLTRGLLVCCSRRSRGALCVRLRRDFEGSNLTRDCAYRCHGIKVSRYNGERSVSNVLNDEDGCSGRQRREMDVVIVVGDTEVVAV